MSGTKFRTLQISESCESQKRRRFALPHATRRERFARSIDEPIESLRQWLLQGALRVQRGLDHRRTATRSPTLVIGVAFLSEGSESLFEVFTPRGQFK